MKLNRKQLEDFIVGSMRDNGENGWGSEEERAALESLRNGTLEIEGYERSQWRRLDPKNPKTFPEIEKHFLAYVFGTMTVMFRHSIETDEKFINRFSIRYGLTHWRPLPPAPGKEEDDA